MPLSDPPASTPSPYTPPLGPEDFEAQLSQGFAHAQDRLETDAETTLFAARLTERLKPQHATRNRTLALGGAGSAGSAIAAGSLEQVFETAPLPLLDGALSGFSLFVGPQTLAAMVMGAMVMAVAFVLPARR
ncbi:MAG: hypothetical protein ACFB2Z_09085 [Maricaulaceae bacterium]